MVLNVRLKEQRKRRNLTAGQVAIALGTSDVFIYQMESGVKNPSLEMLSKLAKQYGCSVDYLLGMVDTPQGRVVGVEGEGTERLLALWEATPAKSQEELLDVVLAYGSLTPEQQLLVDRLLKELVQLNTPKIIGDAE